VGQAFTAGVVRALDEMRTRGVRVAALLVDTIFSSDGVFANPPGFLREAVDRVRGAGGIFIADEVGFCTPRSCPRSRHPRQADGQ
jgi:4-aminobutyrate aminotransferase-like enzyme